jgi:nitrogen-specific signal transduction histidine kinase
LSRSSPPRGVGEGSGLGLDIVRRIVSGHRGDVTVHSQPGATVFTVALPAAAAV